MKNKLILFWIIMAITIAAIFVIYKKPTSLGLDLVGGSRLMLEAQTSESVPKITPEIMDSLQYAIENRVNAMGVGETIVQRVGLKRLLVEIPNITDTAKAKEFIGQTAQLEFKRPIVGPNGEISWESTGLTGKDLKKSLVGSTPATGEWMVELEFNAQGAQKFSDLTKELTGKQMAIFFNGKLQSAPRVNEQITGGRAQITGGEGGDGGTPGSGGRVIVNYNDNNTSPMERGRLVVLYTSTGSNGYAGLSGTHTFEATTLSCGLDGETVCEKTYGPYSVASNEAGAGGNSFFGAGGEPGNSYGDDGESPAATAYGAGGGGGRMKPLGSTTGGNGGGAVINFYY